MCPPSPTARRIALLAVVCLVALAGCGGSGGAATPASGDAGAPAGGDGGSGGESGGASEVGSYYDADGDRVVVREAEMTLRVDDFAAAFDEVQRLVAEHGGYLGDRSQHGEGEWDAGDIVIKVPADSFGAVRDELAALGRVESETVDVQDFTREYDRRESRLSELRADERRIESLLNRTEDPENATELLDELEETRSEIDDLRSEQAPVRRRARTSTITLHMHEPKERKPPGNLVSLAGFGSAFLGAFYGGLGVLQATVAFVGFLLPVVVSGALVLATLAGIGTGGFVVVRYARRTVDWLPVTLFASDRQPSE